MLVSFDFNQSLAISMIDKNMIRQIPLETWKVFFSIMTDDDDAETVNGCEYSQFIKMKWMKMEVGAPVGECN